MKLKNNNIYRLAISTIVLFATLIIGKSRAEIDPANITFGISEESQAYLIYFNYVNSFDSAYVSCTIGEFNVSGFNNIFNVNLQRQVPPLEKKQGTPESGLDEGLTAYSSSEKFTIPGNCEISFYREALGRINYEPDAQVNQRINKYPIELRKWYAGKNSILDRTEWRICILDAQSSKTLFTIDSIGFLPNPNSDIVTAYGTNPDKMKLKVKIPDALTGKEVYIRVFPFRYGDTPAGMDFLIIPSWINLSALHAYDVNPNDGFSIEKVNEREKKAIENEYFKTIIDYCDRYIKQSGGLPSIPYLKKEWWDVLQKRYPNGKVRLGE